MFKVSSHPTPRSLLVKILRVFTLTKIPSTRRETHCSIMYYIHYVFYVGNETLLDNNWMTVVTYIRFEESIISEKEHRGGVDERDPYIYGINRITPLLSTQLLQK